MIPNPYAPLAGAIAVCLAVLPASPAAAVDGVILITQAKALAGNVTPGDTPGFPITLTTSGSFRFGSDLQVPLNRNGIVVAAQQVTIDLNGFQLAGGTLARNGIVEDGSNRSGITIRNGTIGQFKKDAIRGTGSYWTVENMRIVFNGGHGIAAGHLLQVRNSMIYRSGLHGVVAINHASVLNSSIVANDGDGVVCENHCLIAGNMISQNGLSPAGGAGVSANLGTVLGNSITGNSGVGISGSFTGYGNNTLVTNNGGGGAQISNGLIPIQPNACSPAC